MNPLSNYPQARQIAYYVSFLVGLVLGATQVGYATIDGAGQPTWLTVALNVYAFVAAALGLTAAQNVPSYRDVVEGDAPPPPLNERGQSAVGVALIVLIVVIILVFLVPALR